MDSINVSGFQCSKVRFKHFEQITVIRVNWKHLDQVNGTCSRHYPDLATLPGAVYSLILCVSSRRLFVCKGGWNEKIMEFI